MTEPLFRQCFVIYGGEEYSSIAYFLSVKRAEHRSPFKDTERGK